MVVAASGLEPLTYGLSEHRGDLMGSENCLLYSIFSFIASTNVRACCIETR